jgi:thiol:disulfide interchange protein
MKMRYLVAAFAVGIAVLILTGKGKQGARAPAGGGKISWLTDFPPALAKAKETGRPIMIDFYADWCGPCKMLDAQTYSDNRVAAASTNLVMVRIDVDRNQPLASRYRVESIPTIVVLNSEGTEMKRETGFIRVGPMLTMMERATAKE